MAELPVRASDAPLSIKLQVIVQEAFELSELWEKRTLDCFASVLSHRYAAQVKGPASAVPHLRSLLDPLPQARELRRQPRVEKRLRATSHQLPNFRGTVVDLSLSGLGMLVEKTVERGKVLEFEIDFEEQRSVRLALRGKVCWCRPEPDGGFRIGVQFSQLSQDQAWELREVVQKLLSGVVVDEKFLRG